MIIEQLARKNILNLEPYASARKESTPTDQQILLNANESPWNTPYNRYPDPHPPKLHQKVAHHYDLHPNQCLMTRSACDGIDSLLRSFCEPTQDAIMICPPTFGLYEVNAHIQGAEVIKVPLRKGPQFALDISAIQKHWRPSIKLLFLCSPNNPTGSSLSEEDLQALCDFTRDKALVVLDEAYIEFSDEASSSQFLPQQEHLVILRTFSKAFGLAGARFGAILANEAVIQLVGKVLPPYPFPTPVIDLIEAALSPEALTITRDHIATLRAQRTWLFNQLTALSLKAPVGIQTVFPSDGNFLLVRFNDSQGVFEKLASAGIMVRNFFSTPGCEGCLRITVGLPEENQQLLECLSS